jgi:toxin HigB-1
MIQNFGHQGLGRFCFNDDGRLLNQNHVERIRILLDVLNRANTVQGMNITGAHLHELKGHRKTTWSMRISGNCPLTFRFEMGHAHDVNLEDYH